MHANLVLLVMLYTGDGTVPAAKTAEPCVLPDPNSLPFPVGSPPLNPGIFFVSGRTLGHLSGSWQGCGWLNRNGSAVTACLGYGRSPIAVTYQLPFFETAVSRYTARAGTENGLLGEWYLGRGLTAELCLDLF